MSFDSLEHVRQLFQGIAQSLVSNPMHSAIAASVADSDVVLDLFEDLDEHKQAPVILFAAVHYLVLKGTDHPLARVYEAPGLKSSLEIAGPTFVDFCEQHSKEIISLMRRHDVQTNEVNRCVGLMPILMHIARTAKRQPALVELGASAGLNLLFDRYRYDYLGGPVLGPPGAQVRLTTQIRGHAPKLDLAPPLVDFRVGIDLSPIDVNDDEETTWLQACLWVGEVGREQRLTAALDLARREWPDVREGDALVDLPKIIEDLPTDQELCIFTSWMMGWLSDQDRERLDELLHNIATHRDVWWISFEGNGNVPAIAKLDDLPHDSSVWALQHLTQGYSDARIMALMQHHGSWLEWRDPETTAW